MLEPDQDLEFLFDISKQIKAFYETEVIFLTQKDYADPIFNALCSIRAALNESDKKRIIDIIVDFHLQWLNAISEVQDFKKRLVEDFPREEVYEAITFTTDAMASRLKYYQRYMEKYRKSLPNDKQAEILADLEIVEEMHSDVTIALLEKLKHFRNYVCFDEFKVKIKEEIDDLLQWLDKNHDGLSLILTKYINVHIPHFTGALTKTLQQIVDELNTNPTESAQLMLNKLKTKGKEIGSLIRCTAGHTLELSKVFDKINNLDDRINRLMNEPTSAAVMALKHKKKYLESRVSSLENLKTTVKRLQETQNVQLPEDVMEDDQVCPCEDYFQLRVFNHLLPTVDRQRLVTDLCYIWNVAVHGERSQQSMISILSVPADEREEFTDEKGTFYVDAHSRRIYKLPDSDTPFQPNECGDLVPVNDDIDHVYFYDDCGRYYIDTLTRQRRYKAHATASEYKMDPTGVLLKVKEEREGVIYYYDNYGRYYIDNDGKSIYRDEDHLSEYENDGLGNLVRVRSQLDVFQPCPDDAHVTEDFKYLKQTVGAALRKCIAGVLLLQPPDPIKYLSACLVKFRENMELKETRSKEKEELNIEREIIAAEERAAAERAAMEAALSMQGGSEASYDSNVLMYTSSNQNEIVSVELSSPK